METIGKDNFKYFINLNLLFKGEILKLSGKDKFTILINNFRTP